MVVDSGSVVEKSGCGVGESDSGLVNIEISNAVGLSLSRTRFRSLKVKENQSTGCLLL
jgi:hypothetical protein